MDRTRTHFPTIAALILLTVVPCAALAHCDGMDGPVVKAARQALDRGDVNKALIWIQAGDEAELRKAFDKALAVRKLSPAARDLADLYFFETVVRLHRAGEGAPYNGLQPAGRDLGPAIPAADKAVDEGSAGALVKMLVDAASGGVRERLEKVLATRNFKGEDMRARREHVKAYVEFVHYVEGLYTATRGVGHGHSLDEPEKAMEHEHR